MNDIKLCAPCIFGLEGVLGDELRKLDIENVSVENGRVLFSGDMNTIARANLCLRTAERVEIVIGSFKAVTFDNLFEGVKSLDWERWIGKDDAFPVTGWSLNSKLFSVSDCQKIIKKAVVEHLKQKYKTSWFNETGATHQIRFSILKDNVTVMLDTSGVGLHKRGYRVTSVEAPIKETLAAAMVILSRPYSDSTIYDPFCGSGTFLIESALHARNIPPGLKRRFAVEHWDSFDISAIKTERERARTCINKDIDFSAVGSDIDSSAVELALSNAKKAGVDDCISVINADVAQFSPSTERGIVICNPPYGERLLDVETARNIYKTMGSVFERKRGYRYNIISPDEEFEKFFGRKADKKRKMYNGMLKCNLYMFFK